MASLPVIEPLLEKAEEDPEILAVILYGSTARGEPSPSDLDICLVLSDTQDRFEATEKRLEFLQAFDADIQSFQALPIPLRQRVLKEGEILLVKDEDALYELARDTIRASTYFQRAYETYLEGVRAGS